MPDLRNIVASMETLVKDAETQDLSRSEIVAWVKEDLKQLKEFTEDMNRCPHAMFYTGAGACPQCGQ